jgi:hypothetical protein
VSKAASPYAGLAPETWPAKTRELLKRFPLTQDEIVAPVLAAWDGIFESRIGRHGIRIGVDLFPTPQIMASYLHELIPLEFAALHPGVWRGGMTADEKDLIHVPSPKYSIEIKTSSDPRSIFGNRSYAQTGAASRKDKSGYYLAVNFERFSPDHQTGDAPVAQRPAIRRIRFGWLDHTDWKGQSRSTGQKAVLSRESAAGKLIVLYESSA